VRETCREQHIMPRGDLVGHETNDECPCGPTPYWVLEDDPPDGVLYVHHSLDGREKGEDQR
jgi:hypothetical protein